MDKRPKIERLLLKVSGEVLGGEVSSIGFDRVDSFAAELKTAKESCSEIAVVVGGGNVLRGSRVSGKGIGRVAADYMGMLGTIINALALQSALERLGIGTRVMTAVSMEQLVEPYIRRNALRYLKEGQLIILAGGTGNPYFSTDTAAALRAAEIKADALLKGTKVDGIFCSDPEENPDARMIEALSYTDVLKDDLRVMDAMAVALCRENKIPIIVFNLLKEGNLKKVLEGKKLGTMVQ
ncbi:MAG: UMP kinase [Candidatus Krumholzibacteria bacterium]|nr:UMP kinase [Candidatus Krumholzibacteria bacterium]